MSIVQEALKKAGHEGTPPGKKPDKKNLLPVLFIVLFLAVLGFTIKQLAASHGRRVSAGAISVAEAIIKPISTADASTDRNAISRPSGSPQSAKRNSQFPGFVLSGIMQLVDGPRAIINDVIVGTGDIISGAKVLKIEKDTVVLDKKGSTVTLGMD